MLHTGERERISLLGLEYVPHFSEYARLYGSF